MWLKTPAVLAALPALLASTGTAMQLKYPAHPALLPSTSLPQLPPPAWTALLASSPTCPTKVHARGAFQETSAILGHSKIDLAS
jgi:hypothetical protein